MKKSGDYKTAIDIYKSLYNETGDEKYNKKLDATENEWADAVISSAETLLSEYKCDEAEVAIKKDYMSIN